MGSCLSADRKLRENKASTEVITQLNSKQKQYLSLIYWDLATRNKSKRLDQHHFSLFFELTGLWGDKLFKYFAAAGEHEISLSNFITTMTKIVRAPFQEKTQILFNFIKSPQDEGIRYKQFLKMLYHYSKPQLKEIMTNDGVFVHESIIPSSKQLRKEKQDGIVHLKHEPSLVNIEDNKGKTQFQKAYERISKDYQDPGTLIQFQTEKVTYQVSYCNMGSLTKEYASHIFYKYNINQDHGSMNLSQFRNYVEGNMKLFNTYFAVFHENLWGFDKNSPLFLKHIEKQSSIRFGQQGKREIGYLMLALDALIISSDKSRPEEVLRMINLVGLEVQEQKQLVMVIKDESSESVNIEIEFGSLLETKSWLEQLKSYSNNYFKNKYEILEQIGTGRYSVVYKCRERTTRKEYALKVLQLGKLELREVAAIENESQIMKILKSNQFVKQYETITTKTTIYIVSEYIFGEDLYEYVRKKKKLTEAEAAFLMGMIIEAVIHLHNIDIIHRDLKPENIMVSYKKSQRDTGNLNCSSPNKLLQPRPETIKLIDFGFANYYSVLQEKQHDDVPVGTLGYMAPEVLLGEKPSFQNDTFSIGCIMYFLLRGKYPFCSTNPEGTAILTVKGEYSLYDSVWEEISSSAKELIEMLLKTDPTQRISLKEALNHPWFSQLHNYHN